MSNEIGIAATRVNSVTGEDMRLWEMAVLLHRAMKHIPDGHKDKKAILLYLQTANVASPLRYAPIYGSEKGPSE